MSLLSGKVNGQGHTYSINIGEHDPKSHFPHMLTLPVMRSTSRVATLVGADRCTDERTDRWTPILRHAKADATILLYKTNTESES